MNKKFLLMGVLVLVLGVGFLIFQYSSRTGNIQLAPSQPPSQTQGDITVELSLKTPNTATQSAMPVDLPAGSDHCEVLKKALEQGQIKDLDMRYQEKYQTNGVYVINGIGKTDSPWWVYKINGSDAPSGCSQIKVADGDKILWEYIGE